MHLAHDYINPTPKGGRCHVRFYLPDDVRRDAPVVICSEIPENPGQSVTNAAEYIAAEVISGHGLRRSLSHGLDEDGPPLVWIEHYPRSEAERQAGLKETFDLVVFESYEVREVLAADGWRRTIGRPSWKALDRTTVETLIGPVGGSSGEAPGP